MNRTVLQMAVTCAAVARNICFGLYFFLIGVEYAVILPTINGYLITLQADNTFLGIVLASFSFSGLLTSTLFGYITDKTGSARACIVVGNLLEIAGNFMYFVGRSKYFVLGGRIIAGLGSGAASSAFGTISTATTEKERTSAFAIFMALRQMGLLIGPGLNAFLYLLHFNLGPFVVDQNTSPGLFMALLWLLHTLLFLVLYRDKQQNAVTPQTTTDALQENSSSTQIGFITSGQEKVSRNSDNVIINQTYFKEFLTEEIIVILASSFLVMFAQTGMEAAITPMTLMYFDWHGLSNSYMLLAVGALVILCFLSLHFTSKYFMDRTLLLFGCIILVISNAILFVTVVVLGLTDNAIETPPWVLPAVSIYVIVCVIGIAYFFVPQISLFSKLTKAKTQSFNQGIRIVAIRIGMILGPIWATPMVTKARLPIMTGVNVSVLCLLAAMIMASYKRLVPSPVLENSEDEISESSPLLVRA